MPVDAHGDTLPTGAIARLGTIRFRIGNVGEFALSPDGKLLAVETPTGVFLWNVETGLPTGIRIPFSEQDKHLAPANTGKLIFTADGKTLLCARDQEVRAHDPTTGRHRFSIGFAERDVRMCALPGTSKFAVVSDTTGALVFDAADGRKVASVASEVVFSRLSPSGKVFLCIDKHRCQLVNAASGNAQAEVRNSGTDEFALSPDDRRLYCSRSDGRLLTYDAATGKMLEDLAAPKGWGESQNLSVNLALAPDGTIAYLSRDGRPTFRRDLKAGKWLEPLPETPRGRLVPHPDGKRVLFVGGDGILRRFDLARGREIAPPDGFADDVIVAPSPDGRFVAATSNYGRVDLFDVSGRLRWSLREGGNMAACAWSPDGRTLACVTDDQLAFRDPANGRTVRVLTREGLIDGLPKSDAMSSFGDKIAFSPAGDRLLLSFDSLFDGEKEDRMIVVDPNSGRRTQLVMLPKFSDMALSPLVPTQIAVQCNTGLEIFELANGANRRKAIDPDDESVYGVSTQLTFSPDGSFLLTWVGRGVAVLRDPDTGQRLRKIDVHQNGVGAFAFSPDGLWLATGGDNGLVALWDVVTGEQVWAQGGHTDRVTSLGFAGPRRLVTASRDLSALVWDLRPDDKVKGQPWYALTGYDPRAAYAAIWALADDPASPALLRSKISPVKSTPPEQIRQWITDLGAPRYATREAATTALLGLGRVAEPDLRATRAKTTDEEVRTRLDGLLTRLPRERARAEVIHARAVAAMELAATAEAKKLLAEWAAGAVGARLTVDAKAALGRMGR